jgi:periplasmic protein TonB
MVPDIARRGANWRTDVFMMAASAPRGLRLSAEARSMLPWCIVLSASAHVLLLAGAASSGPRLGGLASQTQPVTGPLRMTLIPPPVASLRDEAAPQVPGQVASPTGAPIDSRPAPELPSSAASASLPSPPARLASSAAASTSAAALASPATRAPVVTDAAASDPWAPGNPAQGAYLPRPLLSVAPKVEVPVLISMPPGADDGARHVGVLSLFIDEQGRVRHVEAAAQLLPPAMEQAAREAFMAARFSPGQIAGRAVKSRINVEVAFDSEIPAGPPVAAGAASAPASAASAQRSP